MGLGYPREKLLSQRCKLHLGEEPDDAGEIQKVIKLWAQNDLPASDAVNPCKAGVVSVPGWCEVLTGIFNTLGVTRAQEQHERAQLLGLMALIFLQVKFLKDGISGSRFPRLFQ